MNRRGFIQTTATKVAATVAGTAAVTAIAAASDRSLATSFTTDALRDATMAAPKNALPRWKGFNLLDFFSPDPANARDATSEDYFKWMADWGFNFVRIPMAYPSYIDIDRSKNITPDDVYKIKPEAVDTIDALVNKALKHNMHVSLNLHR